MHTETTGSTVPLAPVAVRVERAAEMLSVSRAHVYRMIAAGELRTVKTGSRRLVPLEAIETWLQARTT